MGALTIGRIGEPTLPGTTRILVDRLWPRGVPKANAPWDLWMKDLAPTAALRKWYGHDPARYEEFRSQYLGELGERVDHPAVQGVLELARQGEVKLVTATRHVEASHGPILREFLSGFLALGE